MKKKILALLLSSICVLGGTSVYAEDTTITNSSNPQSANVSVSIDKPETWSVLVPKNITLNMSGDTAASDTQSIIVNGDLYGGRKLELNIRDICELHSTKGAANTLIANVETIGGKKSFTSAELHNSEEHKYQFKLTASDVKAETWTGTMTVNVSVS